MASTRTTTTKCALWLPKKNRYCNFPPVSGFSYCGHHLASRGDAPAAKGQERIPCPLDPNHSIYAKDLQRHLKVCPRAKEAALQEAEPYFERNANRGTEAEPEPEPAAEATAPAAAAAAADAPIHRSLNAASRESALGSIGTDALLALLRLVEKAHRESAEAVRPEEGVAEEVASTSVLTKATGEGEGTGAKRQKHAVQNERIVGVMAALGLLSGRGATHIEFGAGKGALSAAVSEASVTPPQHVLVDLIKPHGSADPALVQRGAACVRLKVDICHLRLRGVPQLWPPAAPAAPAAPAPTAAPTAAPTGAPTAARNDAAEASAAAAAAAAAGGGATCEPCAPRGAGKWSAIGKHLCGVATDYTLRCLVAAAAADGSGVGGAGGAGGARRALMDGVVVATCCHHKCEWRSYVNQEYLLALGFTPEQFGTLCAVSGWATGCRGAAKAAAAGEAAAAATEPEEHPPADAAATRELERSIGGRLSAAERVALGLACKRLLDTGRVRYLERHGYRGWLQCYVPESVSPENTLLVAVPE